MTTQDRTEQNKLCWKRIMELEQEKELLLELITENMIKIAEERMSRVK